MNEKAKRRQIDQGIYSGTIESDSGNTDSGDYADPADLNDIAVGDCEHGDGGG
jgi:hypothetical protein